MYIGNAFIVTEIHIYDMVCYSLELYNWFNESGSSSKLLSYQNNNVTLSSVEQE